MHDVDALLLFAVALFFDPVLILLAPLRSGWYILGIIDVERYFSTDPGVV